MPGRPKKKWEPPLKVFFSYSRADSAERDILEQQLTALRVDKLIETWHDRMLPLGKWKPALHEKLNQADILLCLVSRSFLNSSYCMEVEFQRAEERSNFEECRIVPVALKPVDWPGYLKEYTALPDPEKHIVDNPIYPGENGYLEVARLLRQKIEEWTCVPQTRHPVAVERESGPGWVPELDLLPYLCDREPQEGNVIRALRRLKSKDGAPSPPEPDTRPFVIISCGPDLECHEEFLRRIRRNPLPMLLAIQDRPEDWSPKPLYWPDSFELEDDLSDRLGECVATRMNSLRSDAAWLKGLLKDGLTIIESELKGPLTERDGYLLKSYLSYWNTWCTQESPIPARKAVVVAVWVKCNYGEVTAEQLRASFPLSNWPNLRGAVLDELKPITREVAEGWALNDAVKPHYPRDRYHKLSEEIGSLFPEGHDDLAMRRLAPGLLTALRKANIRSG